ncbi:uncharacterized protein LOC105434196 [Pogonomyrmex barbatus]|uniref:Uncharacterized protein LOC105434196 n=1 Tax=Pogonomyrmex barbatus TaxID=144034 RepID=A0A6I9X5T0_9HYME|nr:uncharacterized protein LOC105434196 [Pogonomyrmex barbatus]
MSATHLEVVNDYSTEGFLAAYRFASRRGVAHTLYSDCGTNFIGADAALKKLFIDSSAEYKVIISSISTSGTNWKFNAPASPHMGGKWEAVVKSIKFHLRRTIGDTLLTYAEFSTFLTQIEAVLNSRPLESLSDSENISALIPDYLDGNSFNNRSNNSGLNGQHYLQWQQSISKWHHLFNIIKIGSLLTDERLSPSKWLLARVLELHPGKDGLIRIVTLKTAITTLTRPMAKLAPLPAHSEDHHQHKLADGGRNVRE